MSEIKNLKELFLHELQDCYSFEEQLVGALPKMIKAVEDDELRGALEDHLEETKSQLERVGALIASMGEKPGKVKCAGMAGIIKEGQEIVKEAEGAALDAGIISGAQRVEHYEIAAYGTVRAYARQLGLDEAIEVLEAIENEEKAADTALTGLAMRINVDADSGGDDGEQRGHDHEADGDERDDDQPASKRQRPQAAPRDARDAKKPSVQTRASGGRASSRR